MVDTFQDKRRPYQAAFRLWQMRLYPGWDESSWTGGTGNYKGDLEENMIVYLQDNYMVTRGTYYNKNVIWPEEKVTSEWIRFCNEELQFKIPEWTQTNKEIRVLSASEKEAIRKEKQEQLKVKLETAPTPLHGWDIVPDVLSEFNPTVELKVSYKTGQIKAGDLKNVNETAEQPEVSHNGDPKALYTLLMIDPDAPERWNPSLKEWRHWVVVNIPGSNVNGGQVVSEYKGPSPPTASGTHRYVFLLYKQSGRIAVAKMNDGARNGFSAVKFAQEHNLGEPAGGTLFQIHAPKYT